MMKMNKSLYSLTGILALIVVGCVKESDMNEKYRPEGTPITFSAATGYENGDGTRTEYSGSFFGTGGTPIADAALNSSTTAYERINWVEDDPVRIFYRQPGGGTSNATYEVDGVSNTAEISDASIKVATGSSMLTWAAGTGDHVFTAMYPAYNFDGNTSINFDGTTAGGLIPSVQTPVLQSAGTYAGKYLPEMKYAYMLAYRSIPSSSNAHDVYLPFRPAYTAFEFRIKKPATLDNGSTASYKVKSFKMTTAETDGYLAGNFSVNINGLYTEDGKDRGANWNTTSFNVVNNANRSQEVSVSFVDSSHPQGIDLSTSSDLDFTLLALPRDITKVILTITYNANGTDKTQSVQLKTTGTPAAPVTFLAGKKYIITNSKAGFDEWEYVIEPIDDITTYGHNAASLNVNNIQSYRRSKASGTVEAVHWKAQYWDGTLSQWQDWNAQQGDFSLSSYTGNGVSNLAQSETRTVNLIANTQKETVTKTSTQILQEATPVTNYDLSLHDVFGNEHAQTTANTYVISAPGTYRFPCVYGNAITNGSTNYESFAPGGNDSSIKNIYETYVTTLYDSAHGGGLPIYQYPDVNYIAAFRNAINEKITQPYIINDINSRSGYTVSGENVAIVWQDEQIMSDSDFSLITVGGNKYIQFSLSSANIKPGNIVVALRGAAGGDYTDTKTILWSWQLWITERDLTPIGGIMPANLGWNKIYNGSQKYTDRILPIRLIQIAPSDDPSGAVDNEEFTVSQYGDSEHIAENVGTNPYYQWGRKDPMIPGVYGGSNIVSEPCSDKTIYPGSDYQSMTSNATLIETNSTTQRKPDYGTAIRNPHIVYVAGQDPQAGTTSWISGYIPTWGIWTGDQGRTGSIFQYVREYTAIPYNLWNAYCFGYGNPGTSWSSSTKYKTVYDPCPPGFTVPHRGLEGILGAGTDAPDHSGKNYSMPGGAVQFLPYSGARIFYNTTAAIPGTSVTVPEPGLYLRHVAGASNTYGLYWTDCPSQFTSYSTGVQPDCWSVNFYNHHFHSQMFLFTPSSSSENTDHYTKGTAGAIRPMVDPRY